MMPWTSFSAGQRLATSMGMIAFHPGGVQWRVIEPHELVAPDGFTCISNASEGHPASEGCGKGTGSEPIALE